MKRELSSLDIRVLARELSKELVGSFVDKAYQPSYDEVLLTITGGDRPRRKLLVHVGRFACLTERDREMPQQPSSFAMLLRKHLGNGRIMGVEQLGFDRILQFTLHARGEEYRLVCELFRNGTIILVRGEEIVRPLTSKAWGSRVVKQGSTFKPPPPRGDPSDMDFEAFFEAVRDSDSDIVRTLATRLGLGGEYAEGLLAISREDPGKPAAGLSTEELGLLYENLRMLLQWAEEEPRAHIVRRDGEAITVLPVGLPVKEGDVEEPFKTFSEAVDGYFAETLTEAEVEEVSDEFMGHVERLRHQAEQQETTAEEYEAAVGRNQDLGELIYANFKHCETTLKDLLEAKESLGWKEVERRVAGSDLVRELNTYDGYVVLPLSTGDGEAVDVRLRFTLTVPENAEFYYVRAKRSREKAAGARRALEETLERLEKAEASLRDAEAAGEERIELAQKGGRSTARKRHFWFEHFRWTVTSDGTLVVAGRDASSNERVVKKYLKPRDRYCHADFHGAPSVVVKDPGEGVSETALEEACAMAVVYSKAWSAGRASADAYWVTPEQVTKTPTSGEFVPKGGFIIRGKRNYLKDLEMRLGVGIVEHEGEPLVMGGPMRSVEARANAWVELAPSNEKKESTARAVARALGAELEEVVRVLPPGGCGIVSQHGVREDGV